MSQPMTRPETHAPSVIEVFNPATRAKVGEVPIHGRAEVAAAVDAARAAQREWAARSFRERATLLYRYRDVLIDNKERIADVLTAETGKPRGDAHAVELFYVCDAIGFWAKRAERFLADQTIRPHLMMSKRVYSSYVPMGVVGIIGPWNFPLSLTIGDALPALMAGNAVVIKPSEVTPFSALLGVELAGAAGFPAGLLQAVTGYGETGSDLVELVDMVHFTGSVATGKKVAQRAAAMLKPVTLELGGKDPMIVLRDADLERAANAAVWGGLVNAGQVCISVERVYVEEPVYDVFVAKVVERVQAIRQGLSDADVDIGSMTFPPQLEKVESHVADAVARGAKVLTGGRRNPSFAGLFYEPTVLVDVNHDMAAMRDETFGPTIPIMRVRDQEEAIRLANDSAYGLAASVWTKDVANGRVIARRIESGAVCVNDCLVHYLTVDAPMGGRKESGLGRRHGAEGIRKYCHQQTVLVDRFGLKSEFFWYPSSPAKRRLVSRALNLLYRSGWRRRLLG
jgi:acyl-CoA reductase-like NAD-dependent aldehyde dehydrogenase